MLALISIIFLPVICQVFFSSFKARESGKWSWTDMAELFVLTIGTIVAIALTGQLELISSGHEEFFRMHLALTPFRSTMIIYLVFAYGLGLFAVSKKKSFEESSTGIHHALVLSFAIALIMAQNFYSVLIFSTGMTLCLLVSNRSSSLEVRGHSVHFYLRKELSDFFLILGLLLLSFNLSVHDFTSLEQMLEEGKSPFANLSIILVSLWFFTRLRIFPFISLRQSYFRSIGDRAQLTFMSLYLPAIVLTYCAFAACLVNIPLARNIMMVAGLLSVIIYSVLSLISRRLETAQNFYTYAHYGLIPLGLSLGMSNGLIFYFIYMSILMTLLVYSFSKAKSSGIITVDDLSKLKYSHPLNSLMISSLLLLLIGLPFLGTHSFKFEMIWNVLNQENNFAILSALLVALFLIGLCSLKFIFSLSKPINNPSAQPLSIASALVLLFAVIILVLLGFIHMPMGWNNLALSSVAPYLSPGITDTRIIFQPSWVAYLTMALMFIVPAIITGLVVVLKRQNVQLPHLSIEHRAIQCLEIYVKVRSQGYGVTRAVSLWFQFLTSRSIRRIEIMGHKVFIPLIEMNKFWSGCINRYELRSFHGFLMAIMLAIVIMCCIFYFTLLSVGAVA